MFGFFFGIGFNVPFARSHYSDNWSTSYCIELPFMCRVLDKGASTTNLKSLA